MEISASSFRNDICIYKRIEDGFKIVFETNMFTNKNKIETLLFDERNNNDDHYWLVLSHDIKWIIVGDCVQLPPVDISKYGYYFSGGECDSIHKNSYFCILSQDKIILNLLKF